MNKRLKGKSLAEDEGEDDTKKWAKKLKKKQKLAADKIAKQQLELDNQFIQSDYNETDLKGLKVNHDIDQFEEGKEHILTLKDTDVLDEESGDQLQNLDLVEDERGQERQELRKGLKKSQYTGLDDDEFGENGQFNKPSLLSKYDNELSGDQSTGFRLGDNPAVTNNNKNDNIDNANFGEQKVNKSLLSLDYLKNQETSDYLQEGDVGFKKPKKKKKQKQSSRKADMNDGGENDEMEVDIKPPPPKERTNLEHSNLIDDDDLQSALARQRRSKNKKALKNKKPEDLVNELKNLEEIDKSNEINSNNNSNGSENKGLEFDDTSEFIRSVSLLPQQQQTHEQTTNIEETKPIEDDKEMDITIEDVNNVNDVNNTVDNNELDQNKESGNTPPLAPTADLAPQPGRGVGAILSSLKQQGLIEQVTPEQREKERIQIENGKFLAEKRARDIIRENERQLIKDDISKPQTQREQENRMREARSAQEDKEAFEKDYKPTVDIKYFDEGGRQQTIKEAWKSLNHKFHGKESGVKKKEKNMRKREDERKQMAMAAGDTPLNMASTFQSRQQASGSAHMVLSVGNKGAAPQAETLFDNGVMGGLSKNKSVDDDDIDNSNSGINSTITSNTGITSNNVPTLGEGENRSSFKNSFAPIQEQLPSTNVDNDTNNDNDNNNSIGKIQIGFGKRKSDKVGNENGRESKSLKLDDE